MKTIALRFGEHFSPDCGTIAAHQELIDRIGYVWYGKMGNPVSARIVDELINQDQPKILLISSGKADRYWAFVEDVMRDTPPLNEIPEYYRGMTDKFKTWFKIKKFEKAERGVMANCQVISSGNSLSNVSRHSMSPYFIIDYSNGDEE